LYGDEFIDAYWDDEVFSPPVKKTPIDHKICPFLTTKQAAHYLGLSFRTLEKMRMSASGPSYRRHGRYIRYHIDDLDIWSKGRGGMSASSKSPR
jgi:excisionase family DNA binding protein